MTEPQTFRKKPVEIQAVQFLGDNRREVLSFIYPDMSEVGLRGGVHGVLTLGHVTQIAHAGTRVTA